jgi:outer membrane murein-binding lipoprotein Lpp
MRRTRAVRVGLVLGLTLGLAACGETPPPTPATLLDASTAQQLFERLDRLASALEAMPRASAAPVLQVPTAERTVVADATTELTARIDALEREVAAMRKNMGTAFAPARATAILPMQTHSVVQMSEQLNSEDKTVLQSARRSLFLLTQQQVLERFGMPSDIGVNQDHSIYWAWRDGDRHLLGVTFVDGVAVMFQ